VGYETELSNVHRSPRRLLLLACLAIPVVYSLSAGQGRSWLGHVASNLFYLPVQFSQDPDLQQEQRSRVEATVDGSGIEGVAPYRAVQLALAPLRSCPQPDSRRLDHAVALPPEQEAQLARWLEESSVLPICLEAKELGRAVAYVDWLNVRSPRVVAHMKEFPPRLAEALVERAYARYSMDRVEEGYSDWIAGRRMVARLPENTFESLAERIARNARPAQQAYLRRDLSAATGDIDLPLLLAHSYNESSQHEEAEALVRDLLRHAPEDSRVWEQHGQTLLGQGRFSEAEEALLKAVSLAPDDPEPMNRLGVLYFAWGRTALAEDTFRRALNTAEGEGSYWLWEHLGDVLALQGEQEGAAQAYRSAIEYAPDELEFSAKAKLTGLEK
jgi:Flp pilus assembly protein TadD